MKVSRGFLTFELGAIDGAELPSEFRIFAAGVNATSKGDFLFDADAAAAVMADYAEQGNELMLDYCHAALGAMRAPDPSQAGKAAGWFGLELRDGELWAVNVRWTPAAAASLAAREWRYTSPTFDFDTDSGRILSLINVALTNTPATKHMRPLMAASAMGGSMDPELVKKALDALMGGDEAAALEILKGLIAAAAAGVPAEVPADPAAEPEATGDPATEEPVDEEPAAAMAAASRLMRLSGAETIGAAVDVIDTWRESHLTLERQRAELAAERALLEASARDALGVEMVTNRGKTPAEVWANPLDANDPAKRKLRKVWASLSLADLRAEVAAMPKTATKAVMAGAAPRISTGVAGLTADQLAIAKEMNIDPAVYAENLARLSR